MAIFAISDLHLSTAEATNKSMEIFGRRWADYTERLRRSWQAVVSADDTVIIPGDISWAISLEEAESDFRFLHSLPGKKLLGKGNHDFWWSTATKLRAFIEKMGFDDIRFLHNNAFALENCIIAGTRGWFQDDDTASHGDCEKLINREAARLKLSLDAAVQCRKELPDAEILVFLHFPPVWNGQECKPFLDLLSEYGVKRCYFGHIHGGYAIPKSFSCRGIEMTLLSADHLEFLPKKIEV